ncbi:hypothetical protein EMIT0P253_10097 [Pseudomonas sp. IT-P253]
MGRVGPIKRSQRLALQPVAAAAFGCAAVVNPEHAVQLTLRIAWFHDCCAAERSLALLGSCYTVRCGSTWQRLPLQSAPSSTSPQGTSCPGLNCLPPPSVSLPSG